MKIISPLFSYGARIPEKYTCDGENINPPLEFQDVPKETRSLALLMDDPDVPVSIRPDGMWDHWVVFNIPSSTMGVEEDSFPKGAIIGMNTRGNNSYGGPCPPDREHRYFFRLYALNTGLSLDASASKHDVEQAMKGHILSQAELMGLYERKNS